MSITWTIVRSKWSSLHLAEPEWPSGLQRHACCVWHGWSWVQAPNLHQCLQTCLEVHGSKRLGCHADLYTVSRCCTRDESQEFIARRWQSMQARDPPWLWNPGETSPEVQNNGISGPTKKTYVLQKLKKKVHYTYQNLVELTKKKFNGANRPYPFPDNNQHRLLMHWHLFRITDYKRTTGARSGLSYGIPPFSIYEETWYRTLMSNLEMKLSIFILVFMFVSI